MAQSSGGAGHRGARAQVEPEVEPVAPANRRWYSFDAKIELIKPDNLPNGFSEATIELINRAAVLVVKALDAAVNRARNRHTRIRAAGRGKGTINPAGWLEPEERELEVLTQGEVQALNLLMVEIQSKRISYEEYDGAQETILLYCEKARTALVKFHEQIRESIVERHTVDPSQLSSQEKLELLDKFAADHPGAPISEYVLKLFPELRGAERQSAAQEGPSSAPGRPAKQWSEREPGQTPVEFVRANYGVWRDGAWDPNGLTKPDLRHDMQLYNALAAYERRHPDQALNLPTKKQANDMWVKRILRGEEAPKSVLEAQRFATTARRRGVGANEGRS